MTTCEISKLWAVEYSPSQKQFHIDRVAKVTKSNLRQLMEDKPSDWALLGLFETHEAARAFADGLEDDIVTDEGEAV